MSRKKRVRLDQRVLEVGLAPDISKARALIMAGKVRVGTERLDKPGSPVEADTVPEAIGDERFVGRGAYKMLGALSAFGVTVAGRVCCDVGASTGGFTQVLLQNGAERVYAIDVGYGELAWSLRTDPRVVVMERTNARHLESLPEQVSLAVIDVSFISLKAILPAVRKWLTSDGEILALVKPQFEAPKDLVPPGGVILDPAIHESILLSVLEWCRKEGIALGGLTRSPITGGDGNVEFLAHLVPGGVSAVSVEEAVRKCVEV